jgi:hypothetical protein
VKEIIQPRQEAHNPDAVEKVVADEHADRPTNKDDPNSPSEIEFDSGVCVPHHDKQTSIHGKDCNIVHNAIAVT